MRSTCFARRILGPSTFLPAGGLLVPYFACRKWGRRASSSAPWFSGLHHRHGGAGSTQRRGRRRGGSVGQIPTRFDGSGLVRGSGASQRRRPAPGSPAKSWTEGSALREGFGSGRRQSEPVRALPGRAQPAQPVSHAHPERRSDRRRYHGDGRFTDRVSGSAELEHHCCQPRELQESGGRNERLSHFQQPGTTQ